MSSTVLYLIGYFIFLVGLAIAAHWLGAPSRWIAVGLVILAGLGIATAATKTRRKDPSD